MKTHELLNLSNTQKNIWLSELMYPNTSLNSISGTLFFQEPINIEILEKSIKMFVQHNSFLLTQIKLENGLPFQFIDEHLKIPVNVHTLTSINDLKTLEKNVAKHSFTLIESPLFTFDAFTLPDGTGGLVSCLHHIVSDAWSFGLMAVGIKDIYVSLSQNSELPEKKPSYIEYLDLEHEYLNSSKFEKSKLFWESTYENFPDLSTLKLYTDNSVDVTADRMSFTLDNDISKKIDIYSKTNNISKYSLFMAIFSMYLSRVSRNDDVIIGTPFLNRSTFREKNSMGIFINTMPNRISVDHNLPFIEFVKNVGKTQMSVMRHQKYPYTEILEYTHKKHNLSRNIYDFIISYQNARDDSKDSSIQYTTNWNFQYAILNSLQIHMFDMDDTGNLTLYYDYQLNKYTSEEISEIHSRILFILEQVTSNNINLNEIEIVTPNEKQLLLFDLNKTDVPYDETETVHQLFEEQVNRTPDKVALVFKNTEMTYDEVNKKANSLANYLRKSNVKPNDIIGVCTQRSFEMIIGILGILKAGAAYLPIDPEYPIDRISYMLEDSNCKHVLTTNKTDLLFTSNTSNIINLNIELHDSNNIFSSYNTDNLNSVSSPEDLIYLIYTSGSTGKPKGVMLTHKNLRNCVLALYRLVDFNEDKTMISLTTICFDIFVAEIFGSLLSGLKLVIASEEEQTNPKLLNDLCLKHNVHIIQTTPSRYSILFTSNQLELFKNTTDVLLAGEPIPPHLLKGIQKNSTANIYNMYGPTETTVWATTKDVTRSTEISIGPPITNTKTYILDKFGHLLPPNIPGELYIGGDGVSNGYLNRPDLTKEKFIKSLYFDNMTIYNSGDLAYIKKDGDIMHLGRTDFQVKINGYRVEIGEIESKILSYDNISNVIVLYKNNGLVCYYTATNKLDNHELITYLLEYLPHYMIPSHFEYLETMPLTPNGKIDRSKLPEITKTEIDDNFLEASSETDKKLETIIKEVLKIDIVNFNSSFLALGGDSLNAINLNIKIDNIFNVSLSVKDILACQYIKDISTKINALSSSSINTIKLSKVSEKEYYNVSSSQKSIYYASKIDSSNIAYNTPGKLMLEGELDVEKLENAINSLIELQESFRTYFITLENGDIVQKILPTAEISIDIIECDDLTLDKLILDSIKPFNLEIAPILRVKLFKICSTKHILVFDTHHIIIDGMSLQIFLKQIELFYNDTADLNLSITYKDYSEWENKILKNNILENEENYWVSKFGNYDIPILNLPTDYNRKLISTFRGDKIMSIIADSLHDKINVICRTYNITPNAFLFTAYYILLSKYSSQNDIVIGTPTINRSKPELFDIIGVFINTLPIRIQHNDNTSCKDLILNIQELLLDGISNGNFPLNKILDTLKIKRDASRNPLFDTMFTFQSNGDLNLNLNNLSTNIEYINTNISKLDLSLEIIPTTDSYEITLEYSIDLFEKATITRMLNNYLYIVDNLCTTLSSNQDISLSSFEIISNNEKNTLLYDFNNTQNTFNESLTIHQLFEEQVKYNPDKIAVVSNNQSLTYRELNEKANQIASYIKNNYSVSTNDIIGLLTTRTRELTLGQIAILKTGCAYLPIDPTYPEDRVNYMLENSKTKLVLTNLSENSYNNKLCDFINIKIETDNIIYSSNNIQNLNYGDSKSLCYVIYTSGSTGKPKGVALTHINVHNFINGATQEIDFFNKNMLSVTTMSFDIFLVESLLPLTKGLKIILANEDEQNIPKLLSDLVYDHDAHIIQTTPSRYNLLLNDTDNISFFSNFADIITGGEPITKKLLTNLQNISSANIYNIYGPTETTVWSTMADLTGEKDITIGKPIHNTNIYILDRNKQLLPIGAIGEIHIGGKGVGKGYLFNNDLTSKSFIHNPYNSNEIIYNTGDIGKWLPDGNILCLGRSDNQIKISGNRVELSEIEKVILQKNNITNAIVLLKTDSSNRQFLCAYVVSKDRISQSDLRKHISKFLPPYMIPSAMVQMDKIPYTPNGKINKLALPEPDKTLDTANYVPPQTQLQTSLVTMWESLLPIRPIGITDNFFEIGGDSILAMQLQIKLLNNGYKLTYADLYSNPTIANLEQTLNNSNLIDTIIDSNMAEKLDFSNTLHNNLDLPDIISKHEIGNLLLTGATGYLGAHILDYFLSNTTGNVYCILRKDPGLSVEEKLTKKLKYYFNDKYLGYINNRIFAIETDFSQDNIGLSIESYNDLSTKVDFVINSAAKVSHFGNYDDFKKINVTGTQRLLDFCMNFNKKFIQISTMSVSGNAFADTFTKTDDFKTEYTFTEKDFYIKQPLENVYIRTKFEAEALILQKISEGLNGYIHRVGNLTNRYSDGHFQPNVNDNAFMNRLKTFSEIGYIPEAMKSGYMEFTPIDKTAEAIIKLIQHSTTQNRIFHLYNNNHIDIPVFTEVLYKLYNKKISIVKDDDFYKQINELFTNTNSLDILQKIISDFDENKKLNYESNIKLNCDFTVKYLSKLGFSWNNTDSDYLQKVFNYLIYINFLEI